MSLANKTKMSLTNKLVSHNETKSKENKMKNYYTDCDICRESSEVTKFVYDYHCNGGEADVYCPDCERQLWWAEELV